MSNPSIERLLNHGEPRARPARPDSAQPERRFRGPDPASDGGGGGSQMEIDREALRRAAAAAPQIELEIRSGLRGLGADSGQASAGIHGWASAGALEKVVSGWSDKLGQIADHVADFEPKLKTTAEHFEQAEQNTTDLIQRLRAW